MVFFNKGIPKGMQRLIFERRRLEDNLTLADCNIKTGSEIFLTLYLTGGGDMFADPTQEPEIFEWSKSASKMEARTTRTMFGGTMSK